MCVQSCACVNKKHGFECTSWWALNALMLLCPLLQILTFSTDKARLSVWRRGSLFPWELIYSDWPFKEKDYLVSHLWEVTLWKLLMIQPWVESWVQILSPTHYVWTWHLFTRLTIDDFLKVCCKPWRIGMQNGQRCCNQAAALGLITL